MKKTKTGIIIGLILCLVGSGAGAFYIWSSMQDSYSSKYTLEEVNQKIMSSQKKLVNEIEKNLNKKNILVDSQRMIGDIEYGGSMTTPISGGSGLVKVEGLDLQMQKNNIDINLDALTFSGALNMMKEQADIEFSLGDSHFISNASGSYIKVNDIVQKFSNLPEEIIPQEWIMTLNKLASDQKYIDLSHNFMYSTMHDQYIDQNSQGEKMQQFIMDFLKNEPVFIAYKQEDTKYHLTLSKNVCKIIKMGKIDLDIEEEDITVPSSLIVSHDIYQKNEQEIPSYDDFVNNYENCDEQEYSNLKDYIKSSDFHEIHALYVELSDKKIHLAADYSFHLPEDDTQNSASIHGKYDSVFELMKPIESTMSFNIDHENITGSGIFIEYKDDTLSGFVDIDMPAYNFDSNLSLSGSQDIQSITGDYSFVIDEDMLDIMNLSRQVKSINLSGEIHSENIKDSGTMEIINTFSTQGEIEVSGDLEIKSDYLYTQKTQSGSTLIKGTVSMGDQATPIYGDAKIMWNMNEIDSLYTGENSIMFNMPNIASGEYFMNYSIDNSKAVEADFKTPENTITEKSLNLLLKINKKKAEKIKEQERLKKINTYKTDPSVFHEYTVDAINSKLYSDLRTLLGATEVTLSTGKYTLTDIISVSETIKLDDGSILYIGTPNLTVLNLNPKDLINLYGNNYDMRVLINETNNESYYQVGGPKLSQDEDDFYIRGNYIQVTSDDPKSLFDIEKK